MKRSYLITWFKNGYHESVRETLVNIPKPTGKTSKDAKAALDIFMTYNGSLKKNTIVSIKELDENKKQIGKDITPSKNKDIFLPNFFLRK